MTSSPTLLRSLPQREDQAEDAAVQQPHYRPVRSGVARVA